MNKKMNNSNLIDVDHIRIDQNLTMHEKIEQYIKQINNPYCFIVDGVVVNVSFNGESTLEEKIIDYRKNKSSSNFDY